MKNVKNITLILLIGWLNLSISAQTNNYLNLNTYIPLEPGDERVYVAEDFAVQPDGRLVIVGHSQMENEQDVFVARVYPDGRPDRDFGQNGVMNLDFQSHTTEYASKVLLFDDQIFLSGVSGSRSFVARLHDDGTLDTSFGGMGYCFKAMLNHAEDLSAFYTSSGYRLILAGSVNHGNRENPAIVCITDKGKWCPEYGELGIARVCPLLEGRFYRISVAKNGNLFAIGTVTRPNTNNEDAIVAKFHANGTLNKKFGSGTGYVCVDGPLDNSRNNAFDLHINREGAITVCGDYFVDRDADAYVFRLNRFGQLDHTFGYRRNGYYQSGYAHETDEVSTMVVQNDGRIIIGGRSDFNGDFDFNLTRLHVNGLPDRSFKRNSWHLSEFSSGQDNIRAMCIDPSDHLITLGNSRDASGNRVVLARYPLSKPVYIGSSEYAGMRTDQECSRQKPKSN